LKSQIDVDYLNEEAIKNRSFIPNIRRWQEI
jgi:hypothetical protein